jgi:hypothetical protein
MFWPTIIIFGWYLTGVVSMLMMPRDHRLTYGELIGFLILGVMGPIVLVVAALLAVVSAPFWSRPIFPCRDH